jgi:hypothetical protein
MGHFYNKLVTIELKAEGSILAEFLNKPELGMYELPYRKSVEYFTSQSD